MESKEIILAVETSGRYGSVAAGIGGNILAESSFSGTLRHASELFVHIRLLLDRLCCQSCDIKQVAISIGPGSFTGLRIAVTMAKMMNLANGTEIIPVRTSDALIAGLPEQIDSCPAGAVTIIDAKRGRFCIAAFRQTESGWEKFVPDCLTTAPEFISSISAEQGTVRLLGEALVHYSRLFQYPSTYLADQQYWYPRAAALYRCAIQQAAVTGFADAATLVPFYLNQPDIVRGNTP